MASSQSVAAARNNSQGVRTSRATLAAFAFGIPLAVAILAAIQYGPVPDEMKRYVSHPVECVEVIMFCCALGALGAKFLGSWTERRACHSEILPRWDGRPTAVSEAESLLSQLNSKHRNWRNTWIVRRTTAVLEFLHSRGSAKELDDHLRGLADSDAIALEGSYSLTRFITWAVPILGFLGTVLGITKAISGVTPEVLEHDLSQVTDGLAEAFDTTALALALTMVTMFISFLVERTEQAILDKVDRFTEQELAHRFERGEGGVGDEVVGAVRRQADVLLGAMDKLVERQTSLWSNALQEAEQRRTTYEQRQQEMLTASLERAMRNTLEAHEKSIQAMEKQHRELNGGLLKQMAELARTVHDAGREQHAALAQVTASVGTHVEAIARLQESEEHLRRLQESVNKNLESLAGSGAFEEAMHSLTAAIHLLTARSAPAPASSASRMGTRGAAA